MLQARRDVVWMGSVKLGRDVRGREGPAANDGGELKEETICEAPATDDVGRVVEAMLDASSSSEESTNWASCHDEDESQAEGPQGLWLGADHPDGSLSEEGLLPQGLWAELGAGAG